MMIQFKKEAYHIYQKNLVFDKKYCSLQKTDKEYIALWSKKKATYQSAQSVSYTLSSYSPTFFTE